MTLVVVIMHSKHWNKQLIYTHSLWILHLWKTALQLLPILEIYLLILPILSMGYLLSKR